MARIAAMVCAVLAGIGAALFLTLGPTVTVNGATRSCPGVIVASEAHEGLPHSGACDRARTRWTWDAVGLGLVCLVSGTGAAFYRREDDPGGAAGAVQTAHAD